MALEPENGKSFIGSVFVERFLEEVNVVGR